MVHHIIDFRQITSEETNKHFSNFLRMKDNPKTNRKLKIVMKDLEEMTDEEFEDFLEDLDEDEREGYEEERYQRTMESRLNRSSQFRRLYGEDLGF